MTCDRFEFPFNLVVSSEVLRWSSVLLQVKTSSIASSFALHANFNQDESRASWPSCSSIASTILALRR